MKVCENCGKEHDGSYGSGRFCSDKCARSFAANKGDKKETKGSNCSVCGKEIEVNKRASPSQVKCDGCRKKRHNICKVCGQEKPCQRPDICRRYQLLPALSKYFGFDESKVGTIEVYEEFERVRNILIEDYGNNELSLIGITEKYSFPHCKNLNKIFHSLGIQMRNLSEANTNAILNDRLFNPEGGYETGNGKKVFLRSSYELDYANQLDVKQIDYEVEKLRILYGDSQKQVQRIAIPDFYLPEYEMIVEIKSNFTHDEQNMKDKFEAYREHGYECKLVLDKKEYIL